MAAAGLNPAGLCDTLPFEDDREDGTSGAHGLNATDDHGWLERRFAPTRGSLILAGLFVLRFAWIAAG